ncbi:subtilisin-like protease SBT3.9 [Tasmannia lanceolata]|uniref:subtilisin-like protease SBT3.9 n=1 Tax=Tasmannia lanceolata TaxID=3420 RepID=UPI004062A0F2
MLVRKQTMGRAFLMFLIFAQLQFIILPIYASSVYIVYMGERHQNDPKLTLELHHEILSAVLGSKEAALDSILYNYKHGFSGFAALLTHSQANLIADFPGVVRVMPNHILSLHTTRSWDFLQLKPEPFSGLLSKSRSGDGSIIGIMDTGIWPESESFKDDGVGEVPSRWKGICQEGEEFNYSSCNRKIIGARWYVKGYDAEFGKLNTSGMVEFLSSRDAVGHGTHTSSTAAGAFVENASFMGLAQGLARGGAHSARLAVYKVCWGTGGCSSADLLAAFDDAISDGVDVISVSLGSSPPLSAYVEDVVAIGSFHAVAKGITVVCSAGNSGPYSHTVINTAPWIITVAASTIDRSFPTAITLGNNQTLVGQALYTGKHVGKFYRIVYGEDVASSNIDDDRAGSCDSRSLNATLVRGKVVLCFQSRLQRSVMVAMKTVMKARGVGLIFAQFVTKDVTPSSRIPIVQVDFEVGTCVMTYMEKTRNPVVMFSPTKTAVGTVISPEVVFFSSRGPSSLSPSVLKPDIAAPGVNILASWSPASSSSTDTDHHQLPLNFKIESGTSMSCPHISAIVALLKSIHPSWSPSAMKSALITTASVIDEYSQSMVAEGAPHKQADPFDYGGGHVDPNKASDPGLIYDMDVLDYVYFLCSLGYNNSAISLMTRHHTICSKTSRTQEDLNVPSISIPELRKSFMVSRTVTNVGPVSSVYTAHVEAPPGVRVFVKPSILSFNSTVKKLQFTVSFHSRLRVQGRYSFGSLSWEDGVHIVRIPLVVRVVMDEFRVER